MRPDRRQACPVTHRIASHPMPSRLPSEAAGPGGEAHCGSAPWPASIGPRGTQAPMRAAAPAPPTKPLADDLTKSETLMPATDSTALPVLVVGATGSLGSKVIDELLGR